MLKFVVTRRKEIQSCSSDVSSDIPSKIDINNNLNIINNNINISQHVAPQTTTQNERMTQRSKKKKRIAETRQAIILRHKNHRSLSLGGSVKGDSEDEEGDNSIHAWSSCSTPRLVSRWNNPPTDLDDVDDDDDDEVPLHFQRYFRAAGQQNSDDPKPSNPIKIQIDRCPTLSDSNLTLSGKHASFSSYDTCLSSTASSIDPTESPCSSSIISLARSYNNVQLELRKRQSCKRFGFTIVGGMDSPKGAMGIFVGNIHGDGLATGMLQKGDELTSVNGKELKGLTHNEAVKMIKSSGREGCLKLTLKRPKRSKKSRSDSCDEGIVSSNSSPNDNDNNNMSAITLHLNQLSTNLRDSHHLSSSSSSDFQFLRNSRSDDTLTKDSCNFKNDGDDDDDDDEDGDGDDTLIRSPNDAKRNYLYTTRYKNNKIFTIDDNTITITDSGDDNDDNNNNSNNNNYNRNSNDSNNKNNKKKNINNNKGLTRLMTRAAYDFGERYNSSVLDRLRLERVFIFDC